MYAFNSRRERKRAFYEMGKSQKARPIGYASARPIYLLTRRGLFIAARFSAGEFLPARKERKGGIVVTFFSNEAFFDL